MAKNIGINVGEDWQSATMINSSLVDDPTVRPLSIGPDASGRY